MLPRLKLEADMLAFCWFVGEVPGVAGIGDFGPGFFSTPAIASCLQSIDWRCRQPVVMQREVWYAILQGLHALFT